MIVEQIEEILQSKLEEPDFSDCFLIEINLSSKKKLEIILDADAGITLEKCQKISRHIENWLDTEGVLGEDYTIEVSSPGISRPLKFARQYAKNIGRTLQVDTTEGGYFEGVLKSANTAHISLEYETARKEGKKKIKETILQEIPFDNIQKAIVKISF